MSNSFLRKCCTPTNRPLWVFFIMPILEKGKFSMFPHEIAQFLPPREQTVLAWLWKYSDNKTGECFPSITTLALCCCISANSVRASLKLLETSGRIKKKIRKGRHARHNKTNLYTVLVPQNLQYPTSKSEVATSKFEGRTKPTKLNSQNKNQINTLSAKSVDLIVSLLFKSTSFDELGGEIEAVLPQDWRMSWKQALCSAFRNLKTVEEIWSRCALVESLECPWDPPPHTKHSINTVDEALRVYGFTEQRIHAEVKESGWEEWNTYLRELNEMV